MNRPLSEPGRRFVAARDVLLRHGDDLDAARAAFRWPRFETFNWALDYFDPMAAGNDNTGLWLAGPDGDLRLSFAELSHRSGRLASRLREYGVRRGDVLLLVLGNRLELWETLLAAIKLGAVVVPTYVTVTRPDLADRVRRAGVRHVIAEAGLTGLFDGLPGPLTRIAVGGTVTGWTEYPADLAGGTDTFEPDGPTPADSPLFLYFTSGTTAAPKIVKHTQVSYPVGHLSGMFFNGLRPGDVHLNVAAPGWAKHAWSSFFVPWNAEATILSAGAGQTDPAWLLGLLQSKPITGFCAPPTIWRALNAHGLGVRPPRLREATSAGEPLDRSLLAAVRRDWSIDVRDGYGQTETTAQVGVPRGREPVPGSMGWPLPGYPMTVRSTTTGRPVPAGTVGELCVDLADPPAGVMTGYADDEARTAAAFAGGVYHTGDLVVADADGALRYVGRVDDMFKSFDHRISPLELERVLRAHPAATDVAVVPVPHPIGQWVPKAYVVPAAGWPAERSTAEALFAVLRRELPVEKQVHVIEFAAGLPRTASGKVRRAELRDRDPGAEFSADVAGAPTY
jgi:acetyl-CoA synthetase